VTPAEFEAKMREAFGPDHDEEDGHYAGDALMCDVLRAAGYEAGIAVFIDAAKWYA
jgi:hypothetical protein